MKKSSLVIFIICIVISFLLCSIGLTFFILSRYYSNLFAGSEYVASGTGERKDSYIITLPDVKLLEKYQDEDSDMLVIFMASWCHFCREESVDLNRFIVDHPEKKVIVVSHDDTKDDIEGFLLENGFHWFVIFDPDTLIRDNLDKEASGIPAAYLLDSSGNIKNSHIGKIDYDGIKALYD